MVGFFYLKEGAEMSNLKEKIKNAVDKTTGQVKKSAGKISDNKRLETEGKVQASVADVKIKVNEAGEDLKKKPSKSAR